MKISELKSAEPISFEKLKDRYSSHPTAHTSIKEGLDGRPKIVKSGPFGNEMPDLTPEKIKELVIARGMPWDPQYTDRVIPYWASDERVDGQGDIVLANWLFDEFKQNSPMPYSHEWSAPPVGRVIDWRVMMREDGNYRGRALWILGLFATKDMWEWADTIFRLVKGRFLVGGSVGFYSKVIIDIKDDQERARLGLGRYGVILDENHLLEYSPTTIPALASSVIADKMRKGRDNGTLESYDVHMLRELKRQEIQGSKNGKEEWLKTENLLLEIARTLWPKERFELHRELDVPVTLENPPISDPTGQTSFKELSPEVQTAFANLQKAVDSLSATVIPFMNRIEATMTDIADHMNVKPDQPPQDGQDGNPDPNAPATPPADPTKEPPPKKSLETELATAVRHLQTLKRTLKGN